MSSKKFAAQTSCGEQDSTADTLPKLQADNMFTRAVAESKTRPCISFVETRSGTVISLMCARKGGYEDFTREILRRFESYWFLNSVILQYDKSVIHVCRREKGENCAAIRAQNESPGQLSC